MIQHKRWIRRKGSLEIDVSTREHNRRRGNSRPVGIGEGNADRGISGTSGARNDDFVILIVKDINEEDVHNTLGRRASRCVRIKNGISVQVDRREVKWTFGCVCINHVQRDIGTSFIVFDRDGPTAARGSGRHPGTCDRRHIHLHSFAAGNRSTSDADGEVFISLQNQIWNDIDIQLDRSLTLWNDNRAGILCSSQNGGSRASAIGVGNDKVNSRSRVRIVSTVGDREEDRRVCVGCFVDAKHHLRLNGGG